MTLTFNFVFIGDARSKLEAVYHDDIPIPAGVPTDTPVILSVGDLVDFAELDRFMFIVTSRRFSFNAGATAITYLLDLASCDTGQAELKLIK